MSGSDDFSDQLDYSNEDNVPDGLSGFYDLTVGDDYDREMADLLNFIYKLNTDVNTAESDIDSLRTDVDNTKKIVNERETLPAGTILPWMGAGNPPDGWTECDGSNPSGNDSLVPDLTDRFLIGRGENDVGETGGSKSVTLSQSQIPSHSHPVESNISTTITEDINANTNVDSNFGDNYNVDVYANTNSGSNMNVYANTNSGSNVNAYANTNSGSNFSVNSSSNSNTSGGGGGNLSGNLSYDGTHRHNYQDHYLDDDNLAFNTDFPGKYSASYIDFATNNEVTDYGGGHRHNDNYNVNVYVNSNTNTSTNSSMSGNVNTNTNASAYGNVNTNTNANVYGNVNTNTNAGGSINGNVYGNANANTNISGNVNSDTNVSSTVDTVGNGESHENNPPFMGVRYIIKIDGLSAM